MEEHKSHIGDGVTKHVKKETVGPIHAHTHNIPHVTAEVMKKTEENQNLDPHNLMGENKERRSFAERLYPRKPGTKTTGKMEY